MINVSSASSALTALYTSNNTELAKSMSKIASGKRIQTPGDDFAGYLRGSSLNSDIKQFTTVKQDIQEGKATADYAKQVGNNILEDLAKMQDLEDAFTLGTTNGIDQTRLDAMEAEFDSLANSIDNQIQSGAYDGTVVADGTLAKDVIVDINGTTLTITGATVADGAGLAGTIGTDAVAAEIVAGQTFVSDMSSYSDQLDRAMKLTDTVINSKNAIVSTIMDINETEELAKMTNLQVRVQATVSMMSQSTMSQAAIAKLFQ
jgi:flagellin